MENLIREICWEIPIICPDCETRIPDHRIDLKDIRGRFWYLQILCGGCDKSYPSIVDTNFPNVKTAIEQVCGDRGLSEEVRLRNSGEITHSYEKELPRVLEEWWENGPKENPHPPQTVV